MILGIEIALLVMGFAALVTGKLTLSKGRVVYGAAARWLGAVALLPVPLAFCGGLLVAMAMAANGQPLTEESLRWPLTGVEAAAVVLCLVVIYGVGSAVAVSPRRRGAHWDPRVEAFRRQYPERFIVQPLPADPVQGAVPLRTAAFAGYGQPPPVAEAPPAPASRSERPARASWPLLVGVLAVVGVTSWSVTYTSLPAAPQAEPGEHPVRDLADNERADPPAQVPTVLHPSLRRPGARVYLSDLPEFAWKPGAPGWSFGKGGRLGTSGRARTAILYQKETVAKGLSMRPPDTGYARVCYYLGGRAHSLRVKVFLSNGHPQLTPNPTRFLVLGDGKLIWRSDLVRNFSESYFATLDVSRVNVLELRTCVETGSSAGSHAAWFNPYVIVKK